MIDDGKRVLTVEEARKELRVSRSSIYAAVNSGQLKSIRLGRRILIPRAVVDALVKEGDHRLDELDRG